MGLKRQAKKRGKEAYKRLVCPEEVHVHVQAPANGDGATLRAGKETLTVHALFLGSHMDQQAWRSWFCASKCQKLTRRKTVLVTNTLVFRFCHIFSDSLFPQTCFFSCLLLVFLLIFLCDIGGFRSNF
jgi:hypothetical protein